MDLSDKLYKIKSELLEKMGQRGVWNTNLIKIYESPGVYTWPGLLVYMIIGGFEDALHPDSARLSVAVGRNSKACGNLLKAFVEIHREYPKVCVNLQTDVR